LCVALAAASGCSLLPKEDAEEVLPTINPPKLSKKPEYTVKTETLTTKVRGSGKLMSLTEDDVYFVEDNKRIKELYVKPGDQVQAGQLIAELDVSDLETQLRQKKLQTRSEELKMIELLRDPGERSAEQVEQAKIDFELKREELVTLQESIAKAKVTAPISGEIVTVYYNKGDMSKAYEAVATVADLTQLTVASTITQEDLKKVAVGMEVTVDINAAGQHKGKVKQLPNPNKANQNQNNGMYYDPYNQNRQKDTIDQYLVVDLDQMPENAARGTPLSVEIIVSKKENAVTIPLAALRTITGRNYVQVVDDAGTKREVDVELGMQTSTAVEIVKGLTPGQKVVGR
jgi:macrolide-specific efflux system membrane fusion protein